MLNLDLIVGFEWDQGNAEKSDQKHDVLSSETEEIFFNDPPPSLFSSSLFGGRVGWVKGTGSWTGGWAVFGAP